MTQRLTISLPDKHFDTFMELFKQFKVKVETQKNDAVADLSSEEKSISDERLKDYYKNPTDISDFDTTIDEIETNL